MPHLGYLSISHQNFLLSPQTNLGTSHLRLDHLPPELTLQTFGGGSPLPNFTITLRNLSTSYPCPLKITELWDTSAFLTWNGLSPWRISVFPGKNLYCPAQTYCVGSCRPPLPVLSQPFQSTSVFLRYLSTLANPEVTQRFHLTTQHFLPKYLPHPPKKPHIQGIAILLNLDY